jgi:Skp family chaperone for outer membrane proteins
MRASRILIAVMIVAAAGLLVVERLTAQPAAVPQTARIAVCDIVHVFNNYQRATDLGNQFEKRRQKLQNDNRTRAEQLDAIQMDLEGLEPGSKQYESRLADYQKQTIERRVWLEMQEKLIMREHHRLSREMYDEVMGTIDEIARDRGFDLVLFQEQGDIESGSTPELMAQAASRKVLYASPKLDITKTILTRLNQAYKAGR